eukprot:g20316.t1
MTANQTESAVEDSEKGSKPWWRQRRLAVTRSIVATNDCELPVEVAQIDIGGIPGCSAFGFEAREIWLTAFAGILSCCLALGSKSSIPHNGRANHDACCCGTGQFPRLEDTCIIRTTVQIVQWGLGSFTRSSNWRSYFNVVLDKYRYLGWCAGQKRSHSAKVKNLDSPRRSRKMLGQTPQHSLHRQAPFFLRPLACLALSDHTAMAMEILTVTTFSLI